MLPLCEAGFVQHELKNIVFVCVLLRICEQELWNNVKTRAFLFNNDIRRFLVHLTPNFVGISFY